MPWAGSHLANRPVTRRMHKEKFSRPLRLMSSAPVFANGAVTAAMAYAFNQVASSRDDAGYCDEVCEFREMREEQMGHVRRAADTASTMGDVLEEGYYTVAGGGFIAGIGRGLGRVFSRLRFGSRVGIDNARAGHIFRDAPEHLADTPPNRALLTNVANTRSARLGTDQHGNVWSASVRSDGSQVWVQMRGNVIVNGGVSQTPRTFNPATGLSRRERP